MVEIRYHFSMLRMTAVVVLGSAVVLTAADSPLVALAKRTNRSASKTPVITNATLAQHSGRISIATDVENASKQAPKLPPATPRQEPARTAVSPAAAPRPTITMATPVNPSTTVRNIEPQSTAVTVTPQSTAGVIQGTSSVQSITPQSTAGTITPQSTARTITPPN